MALSDEAITMKNAGPDGNRLRKAGCAEIRANDAIQPCSLTELR